MSREIELTRGLVAIVSNVDFKWLNQWKWYASKSSSGLFYAVRRTSRRDSPRTMIHMHREVAKRAGKNIEGEHVDHRNQDSLDNRRGNLRPATHQQNLANRGPQRNNKSGYKGVSWCNRDSKWLAQIKVNQRQMNLGRFDLAEDAAAAYRKAARKHFGQFSSTQKRP